MSDAVKIRLEVACNCYVMREQCLPCDARYEIERLEAKVKAMEWARDQAVQAWEVNTEENDRLRAALEEIRDGATTYDPADYGWQRTGGSFADCQWCDHWSERGVVKHYEHCPARIAREALNDD